MLDDIFANNEKRLRKLRKDYSADTVASMVNDRLKAKKVNETISGKELDGFLKVSRLSKHRALISIGSYNDAIDMGNNPLPA